MELAPGPADPVKVEGAETLAVEVVGVIVVLIGSLFLYL